MKFFETSSECYFYFVSRLVNNFRIKNNFVFPIDLFPIDLFLIEIFHKRKCLAALSYCARSFDA